VSNSQQYVLFVLANRSNASGCALKKFAFSCNLISTVFTSEHTRHRLDAKMTLDAPPARALISLAVAE
jgi:hypothetical protein